MSNRKPRFSLLLFGTICFSVIFQLTTAEQKAMNHAEHDMLEEPVPKFNETGTEPLSYALFPDKKGLFYTHVAFMTIAFWLFMPLGIMFGVAKSNFHLPVQILTVIFASFGFFFGKLYGHSSPNLYEGNVHHSFGWVLFILLVVQVSGGLVRKIANAVKNHKDEANGFEQIGLISREPCVGRSDSVTSDSTLHHNNDEFEERNYEMGDDYELETEDPLSHISEEPSIMKRVMDSISPHIPVFIKHGFKAAADNRFTNTFCRVLHFGLGRIFVLLAFTQTISGMVVYHGVCREWEIFGCIAHLIKGAIFYIYGLITFARYLGSFADKGWAWNYIPNASKFSFEMIECSLIFFYGITNTWMEHFGNDSAWTHKDLEHASIAFMFWWAGLLGMVIESRTIRRLLNKSIPVKSFLINTSSSKTDTHKEISDENQVNFNPIPALTILMTGISMGNHHQDTIYSSRVHYLWGLLISAAAISRMLTYVSLFRNPPKTSIPIRPPTEAIGAFLLVGGSILFMASNAGTIMFLRRNAVDSMFLLNITVSLTAMSLTYVAFLVIVKAWAVNREDTKRLKKLRYISHQKLSGYNQRRQQQHLEDDRNEEDNV